MGLLIPKCPECRMSQLDCLNQSASKATYVCVSCGVHWLLDFDAKKGRRILVKYDPSTKQTDSSVSVIVPDTITVKHSTWAAMRARGAGISAGNALDDLKKRIGDGDVVYVTDLDETTVIGRLVLEGDRLKQVPPVWEEQ